FIPVLFMGGIVGRLLHEFAVTISVAILVSGFVSLSLTPMLSSRFMRVAGAHARHGRIYLFLERFFDGMAAVYDWTLKIVLRHRLATMALSIALFFASVYLFLIMPKGFIPSQDNGQIFGITEAAQDVSFESMVAHQKAVTAIIRSDPNIANMMSFVGAGYGGAGNSGRFFLRLKPREERSLSVDEVIQSLRPKLAQVPGINVYMQNPPPIRIGGQLTRSLYQLTLQGSDPKELYHWVPRIIGQMRDLDGFQDVNTDLQLNSPQIVVDVNRDRALSLGVTPEQIQNALYTAYGNRQISTIYTPANEYQVVTELQPQYQRSPDALSKLYVRSNSGRLVPLDTVSRLQRTVGPLTIAHSGQLPSVTISFNLRP